MTNKFTRMILLLFLSAIPATAFSKEITLNFARIEGLAEQIVGEKLLCEIYERAGIEITITPMPAARALTEANKGRKDGETLRIWSFGEKYPALLRVPTPISSLRTQAFARTENLPALNGVGDLGKYKIAIVKGVQHTTNITEGFMNVHKLSGPSQLMKLVQIGRADIALTGRLNGLYLLKKYVISDVVAVGEPVQELLLYHYLYKDHRHLVPKIDSVIKTMINSGEMSALRKKYEKEYLGNLE